MLAPREGSMAELFRYAAFISHASGTPLSCAACTVRSKATTSLPRSENSTDRRHEEPHLPCLPRPRGLPAVLNGPFAGLRTRPSK